MLKNSKAEKSFCNDAKYAYFIFVHKSSGGGVVSHGLVETVMPMSFTSSPAHIEFAHHSTCVLSDYPEMDSLTVIESHKS